MALTELISPLPMITPKGKGVCHFVIDYGIEHNLIWVVAQLEAPFAGEIWSWSNKDVRLEENETLGRKTPAQPSANSTLNESLS